MAAAEKKAGKPEGQQVTLPDLDIFTLEDLEQVKVLADPLRLKILEELCHGELTTKQVAEKIGEKPTKLYHHVDSLERVGLIRLVRTRQNRGTLEKYYVAIARAFRAGVDVFSGAGEGGDEQREILKQVVSTMLDRASEELQSLVSGGEPKVDLQEEGVLSFLEIRASEDEMAQLQGRVEKLVEDLAKYCSDVEGPDKGRSYRLMLAFYPLDAGRDKKE